MSDRTIGESGNSIDNTDTQEHPCPTCSGPIRETVGMVCQTCGTDYNPKGRLVFVPEGHAFYTFPVPAITDSATDDGAQILDHIAGPLRGAAAHVQDLIDHDERNDIDG